MTSLFIRSSKPLTVAATVILGALFTILLYQRLVWVWEKEFPIATDGFFYLLELRSYAADGTGTYTTNNPFFLTLTGIQLVLGFSPETTYNALVSFNILIFGVALALAASSSPFLFGLLINTTFLASDTLFFRIYAFPQQALSMGLFALGLSVLALRYNDGCKPLIISLALLFLSSVFHLTGAALTMLVCFVGLVFCRFTPLLRALTSLVVISLLAGLLWFADRPLFALSVTDLLPGLPKTCNFTSCSSFERFESWLYLVVALVLVFHARGNKLILILLSAFFLLNAPIWTTEGHMAFRLALTSVWLFFASAALITSLHPRARMTTILWSLSVLVGYIILTHGTYKDPGIAATTLVQHSSIVQRWVPPHAVILAPHGTQFRLRYFWHREAIGGPGVNIADERQTFILTSRRARRACPSIYEIDITAANEHSLRCIQLDRTWSLVKLTR